MVKILVDKENLTKAVRRAVTAVNGASSKGAEKINFSVRENKQGVLKLGICANGGFFAKFLMDCEAVGPQGEISVNLDKEILRVVNALAPLGDEIELGFEDAKVRVSCGQGTAYVNYIADDGKAPEIPNMVPLGNITLKIADLKKGIASVMHAVSAHIKGKEYGWNSCVGICPVTSDDVAQLLFVGCSSAVIASSSMDVTKSNIQGEMPALSVPSDNLNTVVSSLDGEFVALNIMGRKTDNIAEASKPVAICLMDGEGASYIISLLQQAYPAEIAGKIEEYCTGAGFKAKAKKSDLLNAIRVANIQKTESSKSRLGVGLSVDDGKLRLDSYNGENHVSLDCGMQGNTERIILAPYFLEKAIGVCGDDVIIITNSTSGMGKKNPRIVVLAGKECQTLIMPIDTAVVEKSQKEAVAAAKKADKAKKQEEEDLESSEGADEE